MIDTTRFTVVGTVKTEAEAHGIVVDRSSRHVCVTNTYEHTVAVVDLNEREVVARAAVGREPNGITFSPRPTPVEPRRALTCRTRRTSPAA